ncbi:MAG: tryptophan-rich sensory protein [Haliscomenobacteraceae bacterium CHB4]|nr:tryptophan-rich sensory protein [Haliscomenobacteraceae bacterium CHB4]
MFILSPLKTHAFIKMIMKKLLPIFNIIALTGVLVMNYLATALPIAGRTPGEVSDMFPTLFTPAGFTFAIWGVIYLLLIGFVVYQARFFNKESPVFLEKTGWLFVLSCVANAAWLPAFHYLQIGLSLLIMLVLLGSLVAIYLSINDGETITSTAGRWLVRLPFSVYLGWITVATIANTSILLSYLGWSGEPVGPQFWTIVVIAAAVALALLALLRRRDPGFALVILWALYGIFSKRIHDLSTEDGLVEIAAITGITIIGLGVLYLIFSRKRGK